MGERVGAAQEKQTSRHDGKGSLREFAVGARVMVRDGRDKSHWAPGTILERRGPVFYAVKLDSGSVSRKHVDHIWAWNSQELACPKTREFVSPEIADIFPSLLSETSAVASHESSAAAQTSLPSDTSVLLAVMSPQSSSNVCDPRPDRYPTRVRRPVDRFTFS